MLPQQKMALITFDKLNQYRKSLNLKQLTWNSNVYILALEHSYYMAILRKISHDNFSDRLKVFRRKNENVAFFSYFGIGQAEGAERFFAMWRASKDYDENMRGRNLDSGAVAVVRNGDLYYATMINVLV